MFVSLIQAERTNHVVVFYFTDFSIEIYHNNES